MEQKGQLEDYMNSEVGKDLLMPITKVAKDIEPLFNFLHYTDHGLRHSKAIIRYLDMLLENFQLNEHEKFILIAAAYLHDIGMAYTDNVRKIKQSEIDPNKPEFERRRQGHSDRTSRIIKKIHKSFLRPYTDYVATVCKAHSGDPGLKFVENENVTHCTDTIRLPIIAGIFRLSDELHIAENRVNWKIIEHYKLDEKGQFEIYKNLYVKGVKVNNGIIQITFCFPNFFKKDKNSWLKNPFIHNALKKIKDELQLVDRYEILWKNGITLKIGEPIEKWGSDYSLPKKLRMYLTQNFFGNYQGRVQFAGKNLPFLMIGGIFKKDDRNYQWKEKDHSLISKLDKDKYILPKKFRGIYEKIVQAKKKNLGEKFHNAMNYRVKSYNVNTIINFDPSERQRISLEFQKCEYFEFIATNQQLRKGGIRHEEYLNDPYNLRDSELANPLAVLLNVHLTKENKLMIAKRGIDLYEYPNTYHVAVAGSMCHSCKKPGEPEKKDYKTVNGKITPSPIMAAYREAKEEIALGKKHISALFFWGFGRDLNNGKPELLGTIQTTLSEEEVRDIIQTRTDRFDTHYLEFYEFTPANICRLLEDPIKWVPGGYVNVLLTLIGTYGTDAVKQAFSDLGFCVI